MSINSAVRVLSCLLIGFLLTRPVGKKCLAQEEPGESPDSTQLAFNKKIKEAGSDSIKIMHTCYEFGVQLDENEEYERSIELFQTALRIAKNINDHKEAAKIANYLANQYAIIGNFSASNKAYLTALENAKETEDAGQIAKISMNLATNYNFTGDYDKAIQYGLYALKTKETANNPERICYHYVTLGNIFKETNNINKWEEYVLKAYKMKDVANCASFSDIAKIYNSLGGIAEQRNEFDKALSYYDTLHVLSTEHHFDQGISTALTNSADIYRQLNNIPKALELATEAEKYFGGNPYDEIFNNNFKSGLYQLTGEYSKALKLAEENIRKEEIEYYSTEKLKCLELLYELNVALHRYPEAFAWNDSLRVTENKLRDQEVRKSIEELETKYETEKKEQQIELLTTENELKNQRLRAGIVLLAVLLVVIVMILYILQIRRKQARLAQNDLQQKVLRSQMNPHFIFNVLGSIQNYIMGNDTKKAANYLAQFASLTRSTLEYSASESISLSDEIKMLANYMELEKMRKPGKFNFEIITSEELEADFIRIPPMMIQPFVENAIKHGLKNTEAKGLIQLSFHEKGNTLHIGITDNGVGINKAKELKDDGHRSMAMQIFDERCKLFFKKTKQHITKTITDISEETPEQQGTRIQIIIPVDTKL
ncbi:Tetratricopeptide repeat-containing protein [Mariniphaga anaerophila]|uniref:Tetratricopeptide repeat-containing protein n=1 Tax=Mariniphaga anaerophila TaxID=1484053 RepID=A0A1M5DEP9_9BACT|nr:histidine kinase [Mariniphaga anaerophila]SHF65447.1 Tetratricopeptide repeat-containing protein [Mariniphaga anaerophila]